MTDTYNAVRIRACQRETARVVKCHWESKPIAIARGLFESYEDAVNRALAPLHMAVETTFRARLMHRTRRAPKAVIANSRITNHYAWLEATLVNAPSAQCLAGRLTPLDLKIAA